MLGLTQVICKYHVVLEARAYVGNAYDFVHDLVHNSFSAMSICMFPMISSKHALAINTRHGTSFFGRFDTSSKDLMNMVHKTQG